jgi:membrane associated rhomboid family serine protease
MFMSDSLTNNTTNTTMMETHQVQVQSVSVNDFDATGHAVQRMSDTDDDDDHTVNDDSTFSMTESSNNSNSMLDDDEYPMIVISLNHDEETAVTNKADDEETAVTNKADAGKLYSNSNSTQSLGTNSNATNDSIRSLPWASGRQDDVQELCSHVQEAQQKSTVADDGCDGSQQEQHQDPDLALRLKDFYHARHVRSRTYITKPYGMYGLFRTLADVRLDLAWAEDAAWRRAQGEPFVSWARFEKLHDKKFHPCPFTYLIMIVSTVMLVISIALNGWTLAPIKVNPMLGPDASVLLDLGALLTSRIVDHNEWYRLVAPMVLHAGIIHYILNMFAIWLLGTAVECVHGSMETAAVFMLAGVGGNLASAVFAPNTVSVGASGGIFGLLGICLADVLTNWDLLAITSNKSDYNHFPHGRAVFWLIVDVVLSLCIGLTPYVDNFAHVGGFFYGICFGMSLMKRLGSSGFFGQTSMARHCCNCTYAAIGAVLATTVFTMTFVLLLESDGVRATVCPGCRYISCAPFPFWTDDPWWQCDACEQSMARVVYLQGTSELDLTCPDGDIVTIDLMVPDPDLLEIRNQLAGYCRQLC